MSSRHYPPPLGETIFEPFAGSAGYSLRHHEKKVVLWETNQRLNYLWRWLINAATETQIREIPINVPEGTDIRTLGLSPGQQLLLKNWQRTNNLSECWTISKWGHLTGQWTENTRARVAEESQAIKHWQFRPIDFTEIGTYSVDPPYIFNYRYGCPDFDYETLVRNVNSVPAGSRIIACEAVCPKTGRVPDYLPFKPSHLQVTSRRKKTNNHHSKELLYTVDT
jgi:hypothetical protein